MPREVLTKTVHVTGKMEWAPWELAALGFAGVCATILLAVVIKRVIFFLSRPAAARSSPNSPRSTCSSSKQSKQCPPADRLLPATLSATLRFQLRQICWLVAFPFKLIICLTLLLVGLAASLINDPSITASQQVRAEDEEPPRFEDVPSVPSSAVAVTPGAAP